jgi:hypothetical protein
VAGVQGRADAGLGAVPTQEIKISRTALLSDASGISDACAGCVLWDHR